MSYDPQCELLAEFFLRHRATDDHPHVVQMLAQHIQDAIEQWLGTAEPEDEP